MIRDKLIGSAEIDITPIFDKLTHQQWFHLWHDSQSIGRILLDVEIIPTIKNFDYHNSEPLKLSSPIIEQRSNVDQMPANIGMLPDNQPLNKNLYELVANPADPANTANRGLNNSFSFHYSNLNNDIELMNNMKTSLGSIHAHPRAGQNLSNV